MARINSALKVEFIPDEFLLAEHNELIKLTALLRTHKGLWKIPKEFTLGRGHLTFFIDKMEFAYERSILVNNELFARGYKLQDRWSKRWLRKTWYGIPDYFAKGYTPTSKERNLEIDQLIKDIKNAYRPLHYFKHKVSKDTALGIVNKRISEFTSGEVVTFIHYVPIVYKEEDSYPYLLSLKEVNKYINSKDRR